MRINTNTLSLGAWRSYSWATTQLEKSIERLSSGKRINRASDDVAGLAIAERMQSQVRSLNQAMRNVQDGISVVRVAESALSEVNVMLGRAYELAMQAANSIWTKEQRGAIQVELDNLIHEIDRIADFTEFNGRKLLGGADPRVTDLVTALRRSWLGNAESLVQAQYGLAGNPTSLKIIADNSGPHDAWVQGTVDPATGRWTDLELHINLGQVQGFTLPNGGAGPYFNDRLIAHEMTHAVMSQTMNYSSLPQWFREGAAEFIAGADDRVASDLAAMGGDKVALATEINAWTGGSRDYSAAYAGVKYLHQQSLNAGRNGIRDVMTRLAAGDTLDQAITFATNGAITTEAGLRTAFIADAATFIGGPGLTLGDADVGAIGGGTAQTVVPDVIADTWNPLQNFTEIWPDGASAAEVEPIVLQVGPNAGQTIELPELNASAFSLNLVGLDLTEDAAGALDRIQQAIQHVSAKRSTLGAIENRLEHTYNANAVQAENLTAAESRIRDLDMAVEMANFAKLQIMVQASTAMMAQANNIHRDSMQILLQRL